MKKTSVLGIGWDVGGWMGKKQGVAAVRLGADGLHWVGRPTAFQLSRRDRLTPEDLLRRAGVDQVLPDERIVVAIDAPLGFPSSFCRFVSGWPFGDKEHLPSLGRPHREIDNELAYRETDRHIHEQFRIVQDDVVTKTAKKPLSATFDKLGNNATVAISHVRSWREEHGFVVRPMDAYAEGQNRTVIETYPALVKERRSEARGERVQAWFRDRMGDIPEGMTEPSDEFDAAICAVLAACYGADSAGLPWLVGPEDVGISDETVRGEGWIYYLKRPGGSP